MVIQFRSCSGGSTDSVASGLTVSCVCTAIFFGWRLALTTCVTGACTGACSGACNGSGAGTGSGAVAATLNVRFFTALALTAAIISARASSCAFFAFAMSSLLGFPLLVRFRLYHCDP